MFFHRKTLLAITSTFLLACLATLHADARKPNLVFILTDNHGAWTLGCYGNKDIRTPNIDKLAREGMLFTRAFCNNSVCSPSRATFLTGLIPSQHGIHSYLPGENQDSPSDANACKIHEFSSLPKILSQSGYVCGLAGKWHLGGSLQPQEGFSYWFAKPNGHTTAFYNDEMVWEGKVYRETNYTTTVMTDHAVRFIKQNKDKPFFLYLPYNGPYGLGSVVKNPHTNRHTGFYADKPMNSFPRSEVNPWLRQQREMINDLDSMRSYAAAVSGVDDGVGRVLDTLKQLGLEENTLIVFAGDQGLNAGHGGYWGMGDHSRPINTHDATVRIPLIFRHPAKIPAGKTSELMVANYDFLPTVLEHLGLKEKTPTMQRSPGKSFAGALEGKTISWTNVIFHDFENARMIRTEDWKLTIRWPNGPDELYHLASDPDERANLFHVREHSDRKQNLQAQLDKFFRTYADPKYDLWKGGVSKARRLTWAGNQLP